MHVLTLMLLRIVHTLVGFINDVTHINVNAISANVNDDVCSANVHMCVSDVNY